LADQHRYDCIGAYGNNDIITPSIDNLAEDGILYKNSFCSFPICTPSRYSLFTGLYTHQHLGWTNHCSIPSSMPTFPKILSQAGYRTKAVGKMHFTPTYLDLGFDEMILAEQDGVGRYDDDYHRYLENKGEVDRIDLMDQLSEYRQNAPQEYWDSYGAMKSNLTEKDHSTTWIADRAMEEIENWSGDSNMLMVGFIKPHHPFDPPEPWSDMYDPNKLSLLPGWLEECLPQDIDKHKGYFPHEKLSEDALRKVMAYYYAAISHIDYYVGRMIDLLKSKGIYDNTLIIYTSDHGEYMGFHHLLLKQNFMYDPLMKIPLIIKYPAQSKKGENFEGMVVNLDLTTLIIKQAGCQPAEQMQGIDLNKDGKGRDFIFAESYGEYMVRSKTRKLLFCADKEKSQFFDLEQDPLETVNLFYDARYKEEIQEYINVLLKWMLFEARTPTYLDENSHINSRENVPLSNDEHREKSKAYFAEKMK
jgi:arylsulfatase